MTYVAVSANQKTQTHNFICVDRDYESVGEGLPRRQTLHTNWLIYIRP